MLLALAHTKRDITRYPQMGEAVDANSTEICEGIIKEVYECSVV